MKIPLPKMMRHWREREFEKRLTPSTVRWGLGFWAFFVKRPWAYRFGTAVAMRVLRLMGKGSLRKLPLAGGWTEYRDFPLPAGKTFMAQIRGRK